MKKLILFKTDFSHYEVIDGYRIIHRPSNIDIIEYGNHAELKAWNKMRYELSDYYNKLVIIN